MSDYFVKLYASILDSSVWGEAATTRLVWITLLAMADQRGFVEASLPGLARRANVSIEDCTAALAVLSAPDPHSKSEEHEGRRVEKVTRGWLVLNYEAYREMRTRSQDDAARRKREQRAREKAAAEEGGQGGVTGSDSHASGVTVTPVTDASTSTSTSTSPSVCSSSDQDQKQKPIGREGEAGLDIGDGQGGSRFVHFGPCHGIVVGTVRAMRLPDAFLATLRMHLDGEMKHEPATPDQLGLAVQQWAGMDERRFDGRFFAGIVRGVKRRMEVAGNRERNHAEQRSIEGEEQQAKMREIEEREGKLLAYGRREQAERFAELERIADGNVPKKYSGEMRAQMMHGVLVDLARKEWPHAR